MYHFHYNLDTIPHRYVKTLLILLVINTEYYGCNKIDNN